MTDSALVEQALSRIEEARVGVIGDFCVDHYLFVSQGAAETSLETGLPTRQVGEVQVNPGGAANVVYNLAALRTGTIETVGVVGDDMYGRELTRILSRAGANTDGLIVQESGWDTSVYTKVYEGGAEDPRLDIGAGNTLSAETAAEVLETLRAALSRVEVLIINQQIKNTLFTAEFRREVARILSDYPGIEKLVDSRDYADEFPGTVRKINLREARHYAAAAAGAQDPTREARKHTATTAADVEELCTGLSRTWGTPIVVTRGQDGCVVAEGGNMETVPGIGMPRPVDPVGAGDALLAGMAASRAGGMSRAEAARFGNLCAAVTVKKLYRTGTASPEEVRRLAKRPAYRMRPDLAAEPEQARYVDGTRIEVVTSLPRGRAFAYAIFDHDGTVSVLREGWEPVMQRVMVRAVLGQMPGGGSGASGPSAGPGASCSREEVEQAVSALISDTTGIQTIEQMHSLRDLIRNFGCVPESEIKSAEEYKRIYLEELHRMIDRRAEEVRRGMLTSDDVTLKGAPRMLEALRGRGVSLFLASGSDHDAVEAEAELLGYAHLFDGGIFGSVGDAENDPKTVVLEQILNTIGDERAERVVTFGDGPVEIRETKRRGGTAVGVASDEVRRHGLNVEKRKRLILADADLIIPDFAEHDAVLGALFGA